jgi:hypothetical protein
MDFLDFIDDLPHYPLVVTNIAMENGKWPIEIDGLPINSMVIFHGHVSHNQRVKPPFLDGDFQPDFQPIFIDDGYDGSMMVCEKTSVFLEDFPAMEMMITECSI